MCYYDILRFSLIYLLWATNNYCEISADDDSFAFHNDTTLVEGSFCTTVNKVFTTCKKDSECKYVKEIIPENLCSFDGDTPSYCCDNSQEFNSEKVYGLRPIDQICEFYYPRNKPPIYFYVGGTVTLVNQQPHMVAIGWNSSDGEINWKCGASVITLNFIITAAHCAKSQEEPPNIARTNDLNLVVTENNTNPQDHNILEIFVHPLYRPNRVYHDIALMKISPDYRMDSISKPICIWFERDIPETRLTAMGYGTTSFAGPQANELYQGQLELQSNDECARKIPTSPDFPDGLIQQQLCAQDPKGLMDTCQGDSGGPIQLEHQVGKSWRKMIVGITSFGQNCAGSTPGIYTRVSEYVDWMEPILMSDFHNTTEIRNILD